MEVESWLIKMLCPDMPVQAVRSGKGEDLHRSPVPIGRIIYNVQPCSVLLLKPASFTIKSCKAHAVIIFNTLGGIRKSWLGISVLQPLDVLT